MTDSPCPTLRRATWAGILALASLLATTAPAFAASPGQARSLPPATLPADTASVPAAAHAPGARPIPSPALLDARIPAILAAHGLRGLALAVIDGGQVRDVHAFGQRDAAGDPLTQDTVMPAASLTKPVFADVVLQLVDAGRLALDSSIADDLDKPLPDYPATRPYARWHDLADDPRWRAITPRLLLSHRSGLPNFQALEPDGRLHLHFDPGARFAYSGDGINLLQFVLEQGLGLDVAQEMRHRIFDPLGMARTSLTWQPADADDQADGVDAAGRWHPHPRRVRVAAAGSMDTTIADYARFAAAFVRGDGLAAGSRRALTTPQGPITTASQFPTLQPELAPAQRRADLAAGLGVIVFDGPQGPGFYKGGHDDTVGNAWVCLERPGRCVVLLSNDVRAEKAFAELVALVLGDTGMPWEWEYGHPR